MKTKHLIIAALILLINLGRIHAQTHKTIYVDKAGTLISQLTKEEADQITNLTITGKINATDFKYLRDDFPKLEVLDISNIDIRLYSGKSGTYPDKFYIYPPNCIPAYAFCRMENGIAIGKPTLKRVILSNNTRNIEDNAFKGCDHLYICQINKKTAPNLLENALTDSVTAIFIPLGSKDGYRLKKRWENFVFIEGEPVETKIQISMQSSLQTEVQELGLHPKDINFLTIEGKLDAEDLKLITDYMPNLVSVDLSKTNATALSDFSFAQKKYLLRIQLPKGLKAIGQRAFSGCGRLSGTLILPAGVTSIDYGAFMGCDNLQRVIVTGNKLTTIGDQLFGDSESKLYYRNE